MLGIGALFCLFFHLGTTEWGSGAGGGAGGEEEGRRGKRMEEEEEEEGERRPLLPRPKAPSLLLQWKCWLRQPSFYQVGRYQLFCVWADTLGQKKLLFLGGGGNLASSYFNNFFHACSKAG